MKTEEKLTSINGIVVPVEWDEQGHVTAAAISCHNELEYRIGNNKKGSVLLSLVQEEVEATGIIREKGDRKVITVIEYHIRTGVESPDDTFGFKAPRKAHPPDKIGEPPEA